jgi:hypothetical protein
VQGQLRKETVSVEIETHCRHCNRTLHITMDGGMDVSVREPEAAPLVFMPDVDWTNFKGPSIIDPY